MQVNECTARGNVWAREPLLHFLIGGALIFGAHAHLRQDQEMQEWALPAIHVDAAVVERLRSQWQAQWKRPPDLQELRGMVQDHIREEVLYREATALGLDRDDTIIRRRLAQKMEFLTQDLAAAGPVDEAALSKHYEENIGRYREPARLTFTQLYFSREKRGAGAEAAARAALDDLARRPAAAEELGDPCLLPHETHGAAAAEIDARFGGDFAAEVDRFPPGEWRGPVRSSYGFHLVRVTDRVAGREPGLAAVREAVLRDFQEARRQRTNQELLAGLRARYRITVDEEAVDRAAARDVAEASR